MGVGECTDIRDGAPGRSPTPRRRTRFLKRDALPPIEGGITDARKFGDGSSFEERAHCLRCESAMQAARRRLGRHRAELGVRLAPREADGDVEAKLAPRLVTEHGAKRPRRRLVVEGSVDPHLNTCKRRDDRVRRRQGE